MGVINHNAVIATTWHEESFCLVRKRIEEKVPQDQQWLFTFTPRVMNGFQTIVLAPDGSNEGWSESDTGDDLREWFIDLLSRHVYEDGSSCWKWIEVGFGEYGAKVINTNCKNVHNDKEYATDE
jgi:hypothetical protein